MRKDDNEDGKSVPHFRQKCEAVRAENRHTGDQDTAGLEEGTTMPPFTKSPGGILWAIRPGKHAKWTGRSTNRYTGAKQTEKKFKPDGLPSVSREGSHYTYRTHPQGREREVRMEVLLVQSRLTVTLRLMLLMFMHVHSRLRYALS